jgi:hypothetical protein
MASYDVASNIRHALPARRRRRRLALLTLVVAAQVDFETTVSKHFMFSSSQLQALKP